MVHVTLVSVISCRSKHRRKHRGAVTLLLVRGFCQSPTTRLYPMSVVSAGNVSGCRSQSLPRPAALIFKFQIWACPPLPRKPKTCFIESPFFSGNVAIAVTSRALCGRKRLTFQICEGCPMRMTAVQFLRSAYARKEGLPFQKGGSLNGRQHRIIQKPWINPRG